jgi:hypothetical protein
MNKYIRILLIISLPLLVTACSMAKLTVRMSVPMMEGGMVALNKETDLALAEAAMAPNIEVLEGMLVSDPGNRLLGTYAAQAYYGYAYGFVEDADSGRASRLYYRGYLHGKRVLQQFGLGESSMAGTLEELQDEVTALPDDALPAIFWTSMCLSKWVDLNRNEAESIAQLPKAVLLMERAYAIDSTYFMGGPTTYLAVYYGGRSPMLGGNFQLSERYFAEANAINGNRLLTVDLLRAQYLERQRYDRAKFHELLTRVTGSEENLYPEQALINAIARKKAVLLLEKEDEWF